MDVEYISLFLNDRSIVNGFGVPVKASTTVLNWGIDLGIFEGYLKSGRGFPNGYSLFIPDFWHVTHGDAKCLPPEEAECLWNSTVAVRDKLLPFVESTEMVLNPFPGTRFHLKNFVPYEGEQRTKT